MPLHKPVISNQHGALVMAFVPFLYGMLAGQPSLWHLSLGLAWLALYFCSYPLLSLFSKKPTERNRQWAIIYGVISLIFAIPVLIHRPQLWQFFVPILPLAMVQFYFAKQRNERHFLNDLAGILTFGIVGMASYFLSTEQLNVAILIEPTLFFIGTTLYIKSVARERKNPLYLKLSLAWHLAILLIYLFNAQYLIAFAYLIALVRAMLIPRLNWNIKQIGILEFPITLLFLIALIFRA